MPGSGTATARGRWPSTSTGGRGCWRGTSSASGQPRSVLLWGGCIAGGARRGSKFVHQTGPPGVDDLVGVVGRQVVEPLTAVDAQPAAVGAAHGCERQAEDDGVTDQRLEIEVVALDAAHLVLL